MRRTLTLATAALTLAGSLAIADTAAAQYRRDRDRNNHGDAVAAGVLGFALGAALAGNGADVRYRGGYYAPGYYAPRGYYRAPPRAYRYSYGYRAPRRCVVERRWDPYWGRSVRYERCW